jgi:uncharacterized protein YndB with AHSA1/START domain
MAGEYLEVDRPRRLRYTYTMPQFSPIPISSPLTLKRTEKAALS